MAHRILALLVLVLMPVAANAAATSADTLSFEIPSGKGWFAGWYGGPKETQFVDSTTVHGGRFAARLERRAGSSGTFSAATSGVPMNFSGTTIELRGWLKMQDVKGFAGLWLREDGAQGSQLPFENMHERQLDGTRDWAEYSIVLPLDQHANALAFGALLSGTGTVWVDDLKLFVDGKPVAEAPARIKVEDAVAKDHEFDLGSGITVTSVSKIQIESLASLARVWGFVKYYHPRIAAGEVSADYELFRALPGVLAAANRHAAQTAISKWVESVGAPAACTACASDPDTLQMGADIAWIHNKTELGSTLTGQLETIYRNRSNQKENYYVAFAEGAGNPVFDHERSYNDTGYPDAGYRLLALFRLWNVIRYWYPYRNLIDESWDNILVEYIPRVIAAKDSREFMLTMTTLVARLDDGHAHVSKEWQVTPPTGDSRLPVDLTTVDGKFVARAYSDSALGPGSQLELGDRLISVDGRKVDSILAEISPYYGGSNQESRRRNMAFSLTFGSAGPCAVEVERNGKTMKLASRREVYEVATAWKTSFHDLPGPTFQKLSNDVAYVKLSTVKAGDCQSYIEQAAGTKCLIIDIRNYPGEFVPFALGSHLVSKPTPFACFTHAKADNPGAFTWTEPVVIQPGAPRYAGKVAVLVDDASMSQSEYTAMAFRAAGATIVGSTTAGADGNVSRLPLPGGMTVTMTGIGVFYPDRKPTQQIGIVPDLVVRPTIKGIRDGRDEVAEAAVKHLIGVDLRIPTR